MLATHTITFEHEIVLFAVLLLVLGALAIILRRARSVSAHRRRVQTDRTGQRAVSERSQPRVTSAACAGSRTRGAGDGSARPASPALRPARVELPSGAKSNLQATVEEHGLARLVDRMTTARRSWFARSSADAQISELASDDVVVERDLLLGDRVVPHTLFSTTGVYPVLAVAGSTADLATVASLLSGLEAVDGVIRDLRTLLGAERRCAITVIFFCPYEAEAPRVWLGQAGHEAWTVGGPEQLRGWLVAQPGPGLRRDELRVIREAAKPSRYVPGPRIAQS